MNDHAQTVPACSSAASGRNVRQRRHLRPDKPTKHNEERARRAARHLALSDALRTILLAFSRQGIRCAPLRGLVLAQQLYSDPTLRPMGDIDLLVCKRDLPAVTMILKGMGYRLCDRRPGFAQEFSYTLEFFKTTPVHTIVEPHWSIAYPPFVDRLDMEPIWRRCVPGRVCDVDTWVLSPEDELLNLCLHLLHHGDHVEPWRVEEIDAYVRWPPRGLTWSLLVETAGQAGVGRLAAAALERTQRHCGTPLPADFLGQLARGSAAPVAAGTESLAGWFAVRGWRAKWRYALGILFPSPAFMRLHYGLSTRWQLWLWYPRRALRLCIGAAQGFFQLFKGSLDRHPSDAGGNPHTPHAHAGLRRRRCGNHRRDTGSTHAAAL